jgi:membrane protease YdiL (CAAX protease family)
MTAIFRNNDGQLRSGWRIAVCGILLALVIVGINVGWRALGLPGRTANGVPQPWAFFVFTSLISACAFAVVLLLLRYFEQRGPAAIAMPFERKSISLTLAGMLLGALPIALLVGVAVVAGYGDVAVRVFDPPQMLIALLPLLGAGFVLAAWEEFVLRGYVFRQLSLGINPTGAVIISGLIFGLLHSANPGASWQGILYTVVGGMLMGWLLLQSGSLWLLIGYHFGWNATASSVFGLDVSGFGGDSSILQSTLTGPEILTGGSYGFEASLPAVIAEFLVLLLAIYLWPRSAAAPTSNEYAAATGDVLL